jgi:hypothetical protein
MAVNNPLNATDPTGEIAVLDVLLLGFASAFILDRFPELRPFAAIAVGIALGVPGTEFALLTGGGLTQAAIAGFVSGAVGSGNIKGGMRGMATAMLFYGAGRLADGLQAADNAERAAQAFTATGGSSEAAEIAMSSNGGMWGSGGLGRIGLHALAGCANAGVSGGNCGRGAVTAGLTKATGAYLPDSNNDAINTLKYAVIGGTVESIGGGKFANGAMTGAFQYLFNEVYSREQLRATYDFFSRGGHHVVAANSLAGFDIDREVANLSARMTTGTIPTGENNPHGSWNAQHRAYDAAVRSELKDFIEGKQKIHSGYRLSVEDFQKFVNEKVLSSNARPEIRGYLLKIAEYQKANFAAIQGAERRSVVKEFFRSVFGRNR